MYNSIKNKFTLYYDTEKHLFFLTGRKSLDFVVFYIKQYFMNGGIIYATKL